jgi:hypothetical protein
MQPTERGLRTTALDVHSREARFVSVSLYRVSWTKGLAAFLSIFKWMQEEYLQTDPATSFQIPIYYVLMFTFPAHETNKL